MELIFKKLLLLVFFLTIFVDQTLKFFVTRYSGALVSFEPIFKLVYIRNYGGPCGIFFGSQIKNNIIFAMLNFICIIIVLFMAKFCKIFENKISNIALGLTLGGGCGNIIDRIFRGYVVDYIQLKFFPFIFNFADACIFIGMAAIVLSNFRLEKVILDE